MAQLCVFAYYFLLFSPRPASQSGLLVLPTKYRSYMALCQIFTSILSTIYTEQKYIFLVRMCPSHSFPTARPCVRSYTVLYFYKGEGDCFSGKARSSTMKRLLTLLMRTLRLR